MQTVFDPAVIRNELYTRDDKIKSESKEEKPEPAVTSMLVNLLLVNF